MFSIVEGKNNQAYGEADSVVKNGSLFIRAGKNEDWGENVKALRVKKT